MNNEHWISTREKGPVINTKLGRFEASIWKWTKILPPAEDSSSSAEKPAEVEEVSLQFGRWNRKTDAWEERSIRCNIDELRALVEVVEMMNFRDKS